ncbi:transglutaminase family protein [Roseobacter denitrificans]|uniref:Transglutaminase-like superfamily protein, putative n=1 Tax=Roseobacter denitrificans (strain ATCC 33942 / OCh 114) TaxID=375451 RepID=Q160P7_ROSDO|nr:transglutaminase family protein [Roseobacter denitrificans]ABG33546.1 transglutaminase-like superfamily protein, putative [Roseobacter denitrificans OCh 114]AVL52858.1 transglutaminase family protein [Roseobacter denitrificans]SFG04494.1 Transglutaminase-like enzyme, putative cysteine protease [Roseobacter denitrificans OCh 114]
MELSITHKTEYAYEAPVDFALQKVRLRPLDSALQSVQRWSLDITGGKVEAHYSDHYGNHVDLVSAETGTQKLQLVASGVVQTRDTAGVLGKVYGRAPLWHFAQATPLTRAGPQISALAETVGSGKDPLDGLHALSAAILKKVPYEAGHTNSATPAETAVTLGKAVCQDHANIFISAARIAGLPARYVSGYLLMNDTVDQDASHAWAEVHLDSLGWVGFDVSNGVCPDERYIRIAIGRDAHDAAPVYGLRGGSGAESMMVSLQVQQ